MPIIEVTLRNFGPFANGVRQKSFSYLALAKAAITAGHKKGDGLKDGVLSVLQGLSRAANIRRAFSVVDGRLIATSHYQNQVGQTEKGQISNCVGNTVCTLLAERIAQVPWVLSLETYEEEINPTYLPVGQRPDYVGKSISDQWLIFEAKGRTSRPSPANITDWKAQSAAVSHVNGIEVACGLASVALADGDQPLVALWDDPAPEEPSNSQFNLELDSQKFFSLYYNPILALIEMGEQNISRPNARLAYFQDVDLSVGIHEDVRNLLAAQNYDGFNAFARNVISTRDDAVAEREREMLFPDGLIVWLGPSWSESMQDLGGPSANDSATAAVSPQSSGVSPWPLAAPTPHAIRDELTTMVVRDLLGPAGGPDEELDQREDRVTGRYLVGTLAPKSTLVEPEEQDALGTDDADDPEVGATDASTPPAATFFPNSIGMSFVVAPDAKAILINTEWGRYRRIKSTTQVHRKSGEPVNVWKREPYLGNAISVVLKSGVFGPLLPRPDTDPAVIVQGNIRNTPRGWVVTVFLVNTAPEQDRKKDEAWLFQPKMWVLHADEPPQPIFVQRRDWQHDLTKLERLTREETETLEMLYRHRLEFAVGHGVSVTTPKSQADPTRASVLETEFVPLSEIEQQTQPTSSDDPNLGAVVLDMKNLAQMPKAELLTTLRRMKDAYADWIVRESAKLTDPAQRLSDHLAAAQRAIGGCERARKRIGEGIDLLESDVNAEKAFRFANEAMWQQRVHSTFARAVRKKEVSAHSQIDTFDVPSNRSWRLFQLAFVLLNLPSITSLDHADRSHETEAIADLLWFATGGGKTEAYLGLTAYVLALRRLQKEVEGRAGDHGIAVLMRYTLRLLTLQQFQRAAALLCACETIRKQDTLTWGATAFRLGLWVGGKTTPNTLKQAAESLRQGHVGARPGLGGTPHQITSCPWCGCEIRDDHVKVYEPPSDIGRCVTYCGDATGACEFSEAQAPREGLPVMVVDEDIYRRPPSLLIATVDKFAQMPWKGETQNLFGQVDGLCLRHGFLSPEIEDKGNHQSTPGGLPSVRRQPHKPLRPPDLIIQDELHLITGPLGSMVALYETAVDELCSWTVNGKRVRPKVIASTATIRRAPDQVRKLFLRKLEVFPPQGTSIEDSFFAIQRSASDDYPGRRYLGICAFGRRYPAAMIRVYVAAMAAAQKLFGTYDSLADPWMTLIGYFNSIRELAGTRRLVEDDIRARLRDADQRGLAKRQIRFGAVEELTSRKSGIDIPKILERLEVIFDKAQEAQREADRRAGNRPTLRPFDAILATNMISVGVDIDRLGLMVVAGQPKNTSEYIQATSRVGRSHAAPGLVLTLFNWARPRDLSHYETFQHYHETIYKHVEALSVTPFSARALDRGLAGVLVALMRLQGQRLNANEAAGELQDDDAGMPDEIDRICVRAEMAMDDSFSAALIRQMLMERRDHWLARVHNQIDHRLGYRDDSGGVVGLLKQAGVGTWELFTCLNSLRDVEGKIDLVLDQKTHGLRHNN